MDHQKSNFHDFDPFNAPSLQISFMSFSREANLEIWVTSGCLKGWMISSDVNS